MPHDDFEGIEDINHYLLEHKEVTDYIKSRKTDGEAGKVLFLMFDKKTEKVIEDNAVKAVTLTGSEHAGVCDAIISNFKIKTRPGII